MKNVAFRNWRTALLSVCYLFAMTVLVLSCSQSTTTVKEPRLIIDKESLTGMDKESLLIIRVEGKNFEQVVLGLSEELTEEFFLHELIVDKSTKKQQIAPKIKEISPTIVVLMDNISINLYKGYQKGLPQAESIIPSVAVMASFMDIAIKDLKNATGIFYEVPLVTSVVSLRAILSSHSFDKVGVVHREFLTPAIGLNQKYCAREDVELISYPIPNKGDNQSELKNALNQLGKKVDALWIPNDNKLINAELFNSVWIPFAEEFQKPIITGVESLIAPKFEFGTFAVIPDPLQLGTQAAELVFDAMDNDWAVETGKVEPPRSVYKIINLEQAERLFQVDKEKLQNMVDKVLTGTSP
ncbi:ABC transporter substrate binding protein [Beggiatoa sp. PS]|nr:ABC transporter substrate binding protein [Beggiatoa sp. PS]